MPHCTIHAPLRPAHAPHGQQHHYRHLKPNEQAAAITMIDN